MMMWRGREVVKLGRVIVRSYADMPEGCGAAVRKGLVLGMYRTEGEDPKLTPTAERFNERVGGRLCEMIREVGDTAKGKGRGNLFNNLDPEFWSVCMVEIGKEGSGYNLLENIDEGRENVRCAAATGVTKLRKEGMPHIMVEDMCYAQEAAEGASLAAWRYQEFKNKKFQKVVPTLELFESSDSDGWTRGLYFADAQNLVRKFAERPANMMTPTAFAQAAADVLCPCNILVDARDRVWLEQNKFDLFMAIAKGTCEPPILMELSYCGAPPEDPAILMVGKGSTFDAGGLYLKRGTQMDEHRGDMSGAAVIVAVLRAAALLSLPINVSSVLCLTENLPSGMCCKPGDIYFSRNGVCVGLHNPEREGRVYMADALEWGQRFSRPKLVIDVATMTDAMPTLLGDGAAGVWTNSRQLWKQVHKASAITGDRCWKMPLWKFHRKRCTSFDECDISNEGIGNGDPCYAAAFLHEFVPCADWMHFDISGVGMHCHTTSVPYYRMGQMTGRPTRTLIQLLYQLACPPGGTDIKC